MLLTLLCGLAWASPSDPPDDAPAPERYLVAFETTAGDFTVEVRREWAPLAADRFHDLVTAGYYDGSSFFRVVRGFVVQWGLHGDPAVNTAWAGRAALPDERALVSNKAWTLSFASSGPSTRRTQVFVNLRGNASLDEGFAPFAKVKSGKSALRRIYSLYGESPEQVRIREEGDTYLQANWPRLDRIERARLVE